MGNPYIEGQDARRLYQLGIVDLNVILNPYPPKSKEYKEWLKGWDSL